MNPHHQRSRTVTVRLREGRLALVSGLIFSMLVISSPLGISSLTRRNASRRERSALTAKADKLLQIAYLEFSNDRAGLSSGLRKPSVEWAHQELARLLDLRPQANGKITLGVAARLEGHDLTELKSAGFPVAATMGEIVTLETSIDRLPALTSLPSVSKIAAATFDEPANDLASRGAGVSDTNGIRTVTQTGKGVIVGIVDTGIDFRHPDFTKPGSGGQLTRIKALLDMTIYDPTTINVNGSDVTVDAAWNYTLPGGDFPVGRLYTEADINTALGAPKPINQDLDQVKQRDKHGHGTHVAGTAAGNGLGAPSSPGRYGGIAPEADLVVVKANRSNTGEYSFGAFDQISALAFVREQAVVLSEPFVVNMSYGDQFGPHEGTGILETAIDNLVGSGPGRAVCVAAGNSGDEDIHASAVISAGGDVVLGVVPRPDDSPGFLELYYPGADRLSLTITKPDGTLVGPVSYHPDGYVNGTPADPHLNVYNTTDPHYGENNIFVNFKSGSENLGSSPWVFRLHGDRVTAGDHLDAWIWRGNFNTFADPRGRITSPGTSRGAITVGAWTSRGGPSTVGDYAPFTSTGPTVDGRQKPDLSAPGSFLYSSRSSDGTQLQYTYGAGADALAPGVEQTKYGGLAGTSMSTPVVTGAVALLLQSNPNLTAAQIKGILSASATHDAYTGEGWSPRFGYGKLNLESALVAATTNPIDDPRFFVRQHYLDFLSRVPDQDGWDYWTGQLTPCGTDQNCMRQRRIDVSNAFFFEQEYQQSAAYVFRLYRAAYGDDQPLPNPDPSNPAESRKLPAYAAFAPDRARVVGGVQLAQSQLELANAFAQRPDFAGRYPVNLTGPQFIDAVLNTIRTSGGADLSSQHEALVNLFAQGGRGAVLYRLADDSPQSNPINNRAFVDAEYDRAFVVSQYFGYLHRDPDIAGALFWLGQVNRFPIRDLAAQHAMVCSFITSAEYQLRFSAAVTDSNSECPQ